MFQMNFKLRYRHYLTRIIKNPCIFFSERSRAWDYDVIIAGGGIVGMSAAAGLLKKSSGMLRIAVIEKSAQPLLKTSMNLGDPPDIRVYAFSASSIGFLRGIDAWKHIADRYKIYNRMQVWESDDGGFITFPSVSQKNSSDSGLGSIVEDSTVISGIFRSIEDMGHSVDYFFESSIEDVSLPLVSSENYSIGPISIVFSKKEDPKLKRKLTARLLIAADGANSTVRQLAGVPTSGWRYGQDSVVATVKVESEHDTAWQVYLPEGTLALLPLWGQYSSIVWSQPSPLARRSTALSPEEFLRELNNALATFPSSVSSYDRAPEGSPESGLGPSWLPTPYRLIRREVLSVVDAVGKVAALAEGAALPPPRVVSLESPRIRFPLQLQQAHTYVDARLALVGDAAHSIHPQAGQGLNLGLNDVQVLTDIICRGLDTGVDIGSKELLLKEYHRKQFARNSAMLLTVDGIDRIFHSSWKPLKFLRRIGMQAFHGNPLIKDKIGEIASGF